MTDKTCSNCGFINFLGEEVCRKCDQPLVENTPVATHLVETPLVQQPYYQSAPQYGHQSLYGAPRPIAKPRVSYWKAGLISLVALLTVAGVRGCVSGAFKFPLAWEDFRPPGSALTVRMPGKPESAGPITIQSPAGPVIDHTFVFSVPNEGSLEFEILKGLPGTGALPGKSPDPKVLHGALDGIVSETNSTLISQKDTYVHSFPALEFETRPPGASNRVFGKMILIWGDLYVLTVSAKENTQLFSDRDKFLNPPERYGNSY